MACRHRNLLLASGQRGGAIDHLRLVLGEEAHNVRLADLGQPGRRPGSKRLSGDERLPQTSLRTRIEYCPGASLSLGYRVPGDVDAASSPAARRHRLQADEGVVSELADVRYEVADRVARITLDRPERGNGITARLLAGARALRRAGRSRSGRARAAAGRQRTGILRGLRPRRERRGHGSRRARRRRRACRLAARPARGRGQPRSVRHVGSDDRLRDDEPQRQGLHEPVPLRKAGRLQGAWILCGRRYRHGVVLRSARDRRGREDRLPAGSRVGFAHDRPVGSPRGRAARQAAAVHGGFPVGERGRRVGSCDRGSARRIGSRSAPRSCSSGSRACR